MIQLYLEQLRAQLTEGLRAAYLLFGSDPLLLQESQDAIREARPPRAYRTSHRDHRCQYRLARPFFP